MRAFKDVEVEDFVSGKSAEIDGFSGFAPEGFEHRAADFADGGLIGAAGAEVYEAGADEVGSCIVADEITGTFEMSEKTIGSAFVQAGLLGDEAKLEPIVRPVEQIEYGEHLGENTYRG